MEYLQSIIRTLYKKSIWIILGTSLAALIVYINTAKKQGPFNVETALYTGIISGYGIEDNNAGINFAMAQNAIDNLINIIQSEATLKRVSFRLFSYILVKGDAEKDQNGITQTSYNYTYNHMKNSPNGNELISLIDKNSIDKTVENFTKYEKADKTNYIYGLFYFQHPYYSLEALKKIGVNRMGSSDLLKIKYSSNDPGIAYYTIRFLITEFIEEYRKLRYGETDKVIEYFKEELHRIGDQLKIEENELIDYNVDNRIINYYDETKELAAINKEFELRERDILFDYNSSKALLKELEKQMDFNERQAASSIRMLSKLKEASELTGTISEIKTITTGDSIILSQLQIFEDSLYNTRDQLSEISQEYILEKFSKSGIAKDNIIAQWLEQTLLFEKAKAELEVIKEGRTTMNDKYEFFAPIGITLKRKERVLNFIEQSYLTNLRSYNEALMRKKNLEMTSASLKVLNPPAYPINSESINKKRIMILSCLCAFLLLVGIFLLIDFFDRTLRDSNITKKLLKCPFIGSFPQHIKNEKYNLAYKQAATKHLCATILSLFKPRRANQPYILNLLSFEDYSNKEIIAISMVEHWTSKGLIVKHIKLDSIININTSKYVLATNLNDIYQYTDEDIIVVEYPSMNEQFIPNSLLREANLNLLVVSANYGWKAQDISLLNQLEEQIDDLPFTCLNNAPIYDVEKFTGLLPPYSLLRYIGYNFSQLSIAETFRQWKSNI